MAEDPVTGQERNLPATQRRRDEARRKGDVAMSRELNSALVLLAGLIALYLLGGDLLYGMQNSVYFFFQEAATWSPEEDSIIKLAWDSAYQFFLMQWPIVLAILIIGILANVAQVGLFFSFEALQPKWNRLNPANGVKRIFSKRGAVELLKSLLKLGILVWVSWIVIEDNLVGISALMDSELPTILKLTIQIGFDIGIRVAIILLILAIFDFAFQRYVHNESLMMSPAEYKQEMKQYEGDPQIKARIRSVQREMARRRMMEAVPEAEVVITNPTEFAIALAYEEGMAAPTVVAKGQKIVAQRIRDIAEEHEVPIVQNPPLARALFKACEVGDTIPADLYQAVAEVLAYIYQLKGEAGPRRAAEVGV